MRTATKKILAAFLCSAALLVGCNDEISVPSGPDTTPDQFSFTDQTGVETNTVVTSAAVTITGINAPAPVTVTGGTYSVGCTATYISTASNIDNNQTVCARHTSAAAAGTDTNTTLTIGGVSDTFTSTTAGGTDTTPNPFTFTDQTGVPTNTTITSAAVTITGINAAAPVTVSGGTYSVGCTATYISTASTINNNQTVCARHTSAATAATATNTILSVGGVSDTFTSTTAAVGADTTPDQFTFTDQNPVATNTVITSAPVTITGINAAASVTVSGGTYSVGCTATYISTTSTINNNQTVCARHTSAATAGTATNTTLTVGGVSDTFTSTTAGPAVTVVGLLPLLTGTGELQLLDPTTAIVNGTNPKTEDTALTPPPPNPACNDCFNEAETFVTGNISGTSVSNLHAARLAYIKHSPGSNAGGAVFKLDLTKGAPNDPGRISSLADACRIVRSETTDFLNIDNSAVVIERAGADGKCSGLTGTTDNTADNVVAIIRLNSPTMGAGNAGINLPLALDAGNPLYARVDTSGAIVGFVSFEIGSGTPPLLLVRRNASLGAPATLLSVADTTGANIERTDLTHLFVTAHEVDQNLELFRVDGAGTDLSPSTLSPLLYTFVGFNAGNPIQNGLHDGTNLYFSDENLLLRIPLNSTAQNAAVIATMACTTSATCLRIGNRVLDTSSGRVVFEAQDQNITVAGGVFSAATNASIPAPPATVLANNPPPMGGLTDAGAFAAVLVAANGLAYVNLNNHGAEPDALKIKTDGTGTPTKTTSAYWAGGARATSFNFATDFDVPTQFIFLATRVVASGVNTDTLHVVDPADGITGISLGSISNTAESETVSISIKGFGRYALVRAEIVRDTGVPDDDVWFLDAVTVGSIAPLAVTPAFNDIPLTNN